jgi:hypothetical protein
MSMTRSGGFSTVNGRFAYQDHGKVSTQHGGGYKEPSIQYLNLLFSHILTVRSQFNTSLRVGGSLTFPTIDVISLSFVFVSFK